MNPLCMDDDGKLYGIVSGAAAPLSTEDDILNAEAKGKSAKDSFISDRLQKNERFFEPIPRQKLKTFADMGKTAVVKTTKKHELLYKQQSNVAFQSDVTGAVTDGYLLKTNKIKGLPS